MLNIEIAVDFESFYKMNDKRYVLRSNKAFFNNYKEMLKNSNYSVLNIEQMQKLVDKLVNYFEFKYPDSMFDGVNYNSSLNGEFVRWNKISSELDINQLKWRLSSKELTFLECSYENYLYIYGFLNDLEELSLMEVEINADGSLKKDSLEQIVNEGFLNDVNGINTLEELVLRFHKKETDVDYSSLEDWINVHQQRVSLRNQILELVPFALLYSENTIPKNGYSRAKRFMRMFNYEYGINFDYVLDELNEIMMRDYTKKSNFSRKLVRK